MLAQLRTSLEYEKALTAAQIDAAAGRVAVASAGLRDR